MRVIYLYIFFKQISATCFGVLYTILRENFVHLLSTQFLQDYYVRCVIKYKMYNFCRLTMFLTRLKIIYSSFLCLRTLQKCKIFICITLTFRRRIKSHLPFAGIIRSSPYSTRFQDKG